MMLNPLYLRCEVIVELLLRPQTGALQGLSADSLYVPDVKKLVGRDRRRAFNRSISDGSRVRVLHASCAIHGLRPDVKEECKLLKRSATHQLKLVGRDSAQRILKPTPVPVGCVNDHAEMTATALETEFIILPCLDRRVHQRVVAGRNERIWLRARRKFGGDVPAGRQVLESYARILGAAIGHIHQDFREVDEGV